LLKFYGLQGAIPLEVLPSLALAVETEELGLPAGLQDRVIQVYEGLVYMDFSRAQMQEKNGYQHGVYERLDASLLPPLYLAYRPDAGKPKQVRLQPDDPKVQAAMARLASLTQQGRAAILSGDAETLGRLMDENFDIRRQLYTIRSDHLQMVELARSVGACANFAGSGGAIIGPYRDEAMWLMLKAAFESAGCQVIKVPVERTSAPGRCQPHAESSQ
jgi:glucuronokinase